MVNKTFQDVDITKMHIPMIAIFRKPEDVPDGCIARLFDMDKATGTAVVRETVHDLRKDIHMAFPWMVPLQRGKDDVESLIEVWF